MTIVVKYFFQFGFFPWNKNVELNKDKPYHPPNIIGVEKKEGYVLYDLIQLLALFFHRSILKVPHINSYPAHIDHCSLCNTLQNMNIKMGDRAERSVGDINLYTFFKKQLYSFNGNVLQHSTQLCNW